MAILSSLHKKVLSILLLTAALFVLSLGITQTARADFLGCAVSGQNIGDCLDEESTDQTSFTEFEGGLEAPSTAGYSPGLVQATTARDFIINVTNFILGFLGIVAVVIIIYGGFLYVTAAGEEERATKGKKSITYALIGIILILASFAIVNTILLAPSPGGEAGLSGAAPTQGPAGTAEDQQAQRRALFNLAAAEVNTIATNFATAYQNYQELNIDIAELLNVPEIRVAEDFHASLRQKLQILERIKQTAGQFSKMNEVVQPAINALNGWLQLSQQELADAAEPSIWTSEFWEGGAFNDFKEEVESAIGGAGGLFGANKADFALAVVEAQENIADLRSRIEGAVANLADLGDVKASFDALQQELNGLASGSTQTAEATLSYGPTNTDILRILKAMAALSQAVKDILFVHTVVTSDVTQGNAPLIVQFDGLRSLDPLNRTIPSDAYHWDFGDGSTATELYKNSGAAVIHVFEEPGTFVVKLTIDAPAPTSPNDPPVADGVAFARITVRPPITRISLTANVGQQEFPLRTYSQETGNLLIDRGILKVTPSEAAAGIEFDASGTDETRIESVRWNFGDNTPGSEKIIQGPSGVDLTQTHAYTEMGNYTVLLEVTDLLGNVDRKIVAVVVDTPVARFNIAPGTKLAVNQSFSIDASSSSSEGAQIQDFAWNVLTNPTAVDVTGPSNTEAFSAKTVLPGRHQIRLTVTDSLGESDAETISVDSESQAPVGQYKFEFPMANQPGLVAFDGGLSYDPDGEGVLEYKWMVNGLESGNTFEFVQGTASTSAQPRIKFKEKGTYLVALSAIDPNGFGPGIKQEGDAFEKEIIIDNVLDITWDPNDKIAAMLAVNEETGEASALINLNFSSENGVAYEIDWGDGEIESGQMAGIKQSLTHTYTEAGTFVAKASVFDEEDEENSLSRKIFISSSDTPVAVIGMSVNGQEIFDTTEVVTINRTDTIRFSGGASLNVDGTGRRLQYSWDFGNGQRSTQQTANQTYREIGTYEVTLRVANANDVSQVSPTDKLTIEVVGEPPVLRSITAVPTTSDLVTPVTIQVNALGAADPDGQITRYRWWYYDPNNDTDQLGVQVTSAPTATITIGTRGLEGEEKTYKFAVEMTDDENNSISSRDLIDEDRTATLTVTNGPNKAPTASFAVDRTSILAGESVNFSSSSTDPDGQIVAYFWDFEGDGFANNTTSLGSNVSHVFTEGASNGIRVRLKVRDNNESEATSDAVTIYVDAVAQDPVAAFTSAQQEESRTVQFSDTSTADTAAGATILEWSWDFDVSLDSNGDGIKDNDADATTKNPTHEYPDYGIFRTRLTVTDSEGSTGQVNNFVNVKAPVTTAPTGQTLDARLLTNPPASAADGRIHLTGDSANVTLDYSSSVGAITKYAIDKNIYFDTNGNGIKDDDEDYVSTTPGSWTTDFQRAFGAVRVRLTVFDSSGKKDTVEKDIVFDQPATAPASGQTGGQTGLSANIFGVNDVTIPAALVTASGFGILFLSRKRIKKHK